MQYRAILDYSKQFSSALGTNSIVNENHPHARRERVRARVRSTELCIVRQ